MKVTTETMIGGAVVQLELDTNGVKIYSDETGERLFLCRGEKAFAVISLVAFSGEGGGGSFDIKKVADND